MTWTKGTYLNWFNFLELNIRAYQSEIASLQQEVSQQPLDKQGEEKLISETESYREQRRVLKSILADLGMRSERQKQLKRNIDERVRHFSYFLSWAFKKVLIRFLIHLQLLQTLTKFSVVETFNAHMYSLSLNELALPANPLTADGLSEWVDVSTLSQYYFQNILNS
jgi:hypothetical protein